MPLQSVNTQYISDGYEKKNKITLKEKSIVEFLPARWFSSENNNHLNVDKYTTKEYIMRKPESPVFS